MKRKVKKYLCAECGRGTHILYGDKCEKCEMKARKEEDDE